MGIVDFGDMSCTCRKFQLPCILCKHAIAVARHMRLTNVHAWVHPFFRTDIYRAIYQEPINPLGNQCDWLHSLEDKVILPPILDSRRPGRPANKNRRPSQGEIVTPRICSRCHEPGHTRTQCKSPALVPSSVP